MTSTSSTFEAVISAVVGVLLSYSPSVSSPASSRRSSAQAVIRRVIGNGDLAALRDIGRGSVMLGEQIHRNHKGIAKDGDIVIVRTFIIVKVGMMLKGVHLNIAAVQRIVGKRKVGELNQLQRDAFFGKRINGRLPRTPRRPRL